MATNNPSGISETEVVKWKESSDGKAVISTEVEMLPVNADTPRGKLMLLARDGIIRKGVLSEDDTFFTHWFPFPTIPKEQP